MPGNLSFEALKDQVNQGRIDTVVATLVDMQGRLMGKRFHAQHFIDSAWEETHCCDYLLATDLEMATPDGYASTSWERGYGDYIMKPDLSTLRWMPWSPGAAMVLCDVLDHHTHKPVSHSPRAVLQRQVARLADAGFIPAMATEIEFFVFDQSFEQAREQNYSGLSPISPYNEDYHIFQTAKEEGLMRDIRNHLVGAGVPVENTKGEAEAGQAELNIRYADAIDMADNHTIAKAAVKEIAWQHERSVTFLAKTHENTVGSSSHVHQSLRGTDGAALFHDPTADNAFGMSATMQHFLAGQLKYAADCTVFLAPYINSYKRFAPGTFAPTRLIWSDDNRTAAFRLVGSGTPGVRVECRIGGVDLNPYLAAAALLAAGFAGIEEALPLEPAFEGDAYAATDRPAVPATLRAATEALRGSDMLRKAMGDDVVDHYVRAAEWEQQEFDRVVTDYEIRRGFERA